MLNKNLVTLWSISLLALIVCSCENAGASIDPPALAENNSSSSSNVLPTEEYSSSSVKVIESASVIKNDTIELTIVKTHFVYATEGNTNTPSPSSSSGSQVIEIPPNSIANETSSAYAICANGSNTYNANIQVSSNHTVEKVLNLNEAGSYCNIIFERFSALCPSDLEITNNESGCDSKGTLQAKCSYTDAKVNFEDLLEELTEEVTSNCDNMSGAPSLLRYDKK